MNKADRFDAATPYFLAGMVATGAFSGLLALVASAVVVVAATGVLALAVIVATVTYTECAE